MLPAESLAVSCSLGSCFFSGTMLVLPISRSTSLIWNYQFYNEYLLTVTIYTTPSEILVLSRNTFMISAFHFNRTFFLCLEQQFTVNKHKETKINDLKTAKAIDYIFCIVIDFFVFLCYCTFCYCMDIFSVTCTWKFIFHSSLAQRPCLSCNVQW